MTGQPVHTQWKNTEIIAGFGSFRQVGDLLTKRCAPDTRVAVCLGSNAMRRLRFLDKLIDNLSQFNVDVIDAIKENPTAASCQSVADTLAVKNYSAVVALGGGSVIDTAKIANIAAGTEVTAKGLFERVHPRLKKHAAHFITIPTTAGTGSEVTPFATLWDFDGLKKSSLDYPVVAADIAVLDPALTASLPLGLTQSTVADSFSHAVESLSNKNANQMSIALSLRSLELIVTYLPQLLRNLSDTSLRQGIQWASLLSGMAISETRTAAAHALSYALTLRLGIPHGAAVGALLPSVFECNVDCLDTTVRAPLCSLFKAPSGDTLAKNLRDFMETYGLSPKLAPYGLTATLINTIVAESDFTSRLQNNVAALTDNDIYAILEGAL